MNSTDFLDPSKNPNLNSIEAAALFLSDGATTDPVKASIMADNEQNEFDMAAMGRSAAARAMGFDFDVSFYPRMVLVTTRQKPFLRTRARLNIGDVDVQACKLTNEEAMDKLFDAMERLKLKHIEATKTA